MPHSEFRTSEATSETVTAARLDDTANTAGATLREALDQANKISRTIEIVFVEDLSGLRNLAIGKLLITDGEYIEGDGRTAISGDRFGDDVMVNAFIDINQSLESRHPAIS